MIGVRLPDQGTWPHAGSRHKVALLGQDPYSSIPAIPICRPARQPSPTPGSTGAGMSLGKIHPAPRSLVAAAPSRITHIVATMCPRLRLRPCSHGNPSWTPSEQPSRYGHPVSGWLIIHTQLTPGSAPWQGWGHPLSPPASAGPSLPLPQRSQARRRWNRQA